jgi:hypothetical protein
MSMRKFNANKFQSWCLNLASRQFGASRSERDGDASLPRVSRGRERRRCIRIPREARGKLQIYHALGVTARNAADAPKLRDRLFRRTSAFLQNAFITRWVKRKSGAKNNLHAVFID